MKNRKLGKLLKRIDLIQRNLIIKKSIFTFFYLICNCIAFGQNKTTVENLTTNYHLCLDKGEDMYLCSKSYYLSMDSLLKIVSNKLKKSCDSLQLENLKDDEKFWISKRDEQFKMILDANRKQNSSKSSAFKSSNDEIKNEFDHFAPITKERVLDLLTKTNTDFSPENYHFDPTGYYDLIAKDKNDNVIFNEILNEKPTNYFGDIKIKKLNDTTVVMSVFSCLGFPHFSLGSTCDTLKIIQNKIIYSSHYNPQFQLILTVYKLRIVAQFSSVIKNEHLDYGRISDIQGSYFKTSDETPKNSEIIER